MIITVIVLVVVAALAWILLGGYDDGTVYNYDNESLLNIGYHKQNPQGYWPPSLPPVRGVRVTGYYTDEWQPKEE